MATGVIDISLTLDFEALRNQKLQLLETMKNSGDEEVVQKLEGILQIIDNIQDDASNEYGEDVVFGKKCPKCEQFVCTCDDKKEEQIQEIELPCYEVIWSKAYYASGSLFIAASSLDKVHDYMDNHIGDLTGSMQYCPDDDVIDICDVSPGTKPEIILS